MSKALFRFLRGELNGYYITNIHNAMNEYAKDIMRFLYDFDKQQFNLASMSRETLYNLGKFAGIWLPRRPTSEVRTSPYMTEGHIVDGEEFSERGLFNTETESFDFVHTDESITYPDINDLASEVQRSTFIGDEEVQGYIAEGETDVIDDNGNVRPEKVLEVPPLNKAYSDYYGNKFLFLSENQLTWENVSPPLFIELFKAMQWVRYNGESIGALARIIEALCPELVKIVSVTTGTDNIYVTYRYDSSVIITSKESRLALLQYIVDMKFKQVVLVEEQ